MPELPEVETVRRDLDRLIKGATITRAQFLCAPMLLGTTADAAQAAVEGATITELARRGKALIIRLSNGHSMLIHFRMTGQLYPVAPDVEPPKHTRSILWKPPSAPVPVR